jgi:D-cysteine desulfhydrase
LLLRGEKPSIPTGYNLVSSMYGHSIYVARSEYANRIAMFKQYAAQVAGYSGSIAWLDELEDDLGEGPEVRKKVVVVNEGAGDSVALLGKSLVYV